MGCDIHMYVEYAYKKKIPLDGETDKFELEKVWWRGFGGRLNPGRDYLMFSLLSDGVRGSYDESLPPKGLPPKDELSYESSADAFLYISDEKDSSKIGNNECTLESAIRWTQGGYRQIYNDRNGNPRWVDHPDWHSHSWVTAEEYAQVLENYKKLSERFNDGLGGNYNLGYDIILSMMRTIESRGAEPRLVFWFDN